ncbi:MAG: xanthine dehydrogenase family protein subunit M [Candidatus Thermoplasmatota archaeon]
MDLPDIRLHEPRRIEEACALLRKPRSRLLAGGTDLLVDLKQGRVTGIEHLISIRRIPGLEIIEETEDGMRIGALVTPARAASDPRVRRLYPALVDAIDSMAAAQVRNMATICGNIASAVPSSDLAPPLIAMNATARLYDGEAERSVKLVDYFQGPRKTVCGASEILTHLIIPYPRPRSGASYQKFALRGANALAVAGVAAALMLGTDGVIEDASIVLGAVAPVPAVARKTCAHLIGKTASKALFAEAAKIAREEAKPITDIRGTIEYRRELVEVLTKRALGQALERAGGG